MLLRAFGTFIFVLFLSKEYIYVNEEFFVILCFLLFVAGLVVFGFGLARDSFESAIYEIRSTLSTRIVSYRSSLDEVHHYLLQSSEALNLLVLSVGCAASMFCVSVSRDPSRKAAALANGFLAHSVLISYQEEEQAGGKDESHRLVVDPLVPEYRPTLNPEIYLETYPDLSVFGDINVDRDLIFLGVMNSLVAKALVS